MRTYIGRIAAAIVATLVTWIAGALGVEVTEESAAALTEAVTLLGLALYGVTYAVGHKLINRWILPNDVARNPTDADTVRAGRL